MSDVIWSFLVLVAFCAGLYLASWRGRHRPKDVLTLNDASGFTPDMNVRVSSGDGSETCPVGPGCRICRGQRILRDAGKARRKGGWE